jgi:putative oxidoreductase
MNATLLILRRVGLGLAGHGAQKLFGWFEGGGISGAGASFQSIRFRAGRSICPNCAAGSTIFCRLERNGR